MKKSKLISVIVLVLLVLGGIGVFFISDTFDSDPRKTTVDTNKDISLRNSYSQDVNISVMVVRESTNRTVYRETFILNSNEVRSSVYNLKQANPDGIETFTVYSEYMGQERRTEIRTDDCFGNTTVEVTSDGSLFPFYSTC